MSSAPDKTKSTIIVTGCSGLIGTAIIRRLARHYNVVGFDIQEPEDNVPVDFVHVDLTDNENVQDAVLYVRDTYGDRVESVIYLAAYYDFSGDPSPKYEEITVRGTERLLKHLQNQLDVGQFVFSSTMLVHEPTEPGKPITEEDPLQGKWAYPKSKIKTEHLLRETHGDIPLVLLRMAGVYTDTCDSIPIANQIQRIYEERITGHVYPGDTSHGQTYVHIEDVVDAVEQIVERRTDILNDQQVLLVGEPETYSYNQLQRKLGELIHGTDDWTTEGIPKTIAKTGTWIEEKIPGIQEPFVKSHMVAMADDHYELDVSRAENILDWHPRHRLIDTLPSMIAALKNDPVGWYERHDLELPSRLKKQAHQR